MALSEQQGGSARGDGSDATIVVSLLPELPTLDTPPYFLSDEREECQLNLPSLEEEPEEEEEVVELTALEVVSVEVVGEEEQERVGVVEGEGWQEEGRSEQGIRYAEAAHTTKQKRSKSTSQPKAKPFSFRACCTIPDAQGGNELCVLVAGHKGPHQLPSGGTRAHPEPGAQIERVVPTDPPPQAPQAQPAPKKVAEDIVKRGTSNEVCDDLIATVLKEYEEHLVSLKRQSGCSVGRVIDGVKIWYVPAKHQGGEWFALLPCGRKVQGKRVIMDAIKVRALHFTDQEIAERLQFGLNVVVGEIEAADPIVQRALRAEGTNVQQEEHYVTLPVIATPESGKAFADMNDAELKAVLVQGQAELNEREIKKRAGRVIDESRELLRLEEARVARMKDEADVREALLEQGEEKLAQGKVALEEKRKQCTAEFAEKRQKLGDAMAALRDSF